jgi:hypothetical protein
MTGKPLRGECSSVSLECGCYSRGRSWRASRRSNRDTTEAPGRCGSPFGTFSLASNTLDFGDAVTVQTYCVVVKSREVFRLDDVLGYRTTAAHFPQTEFGCDFGWVRISDVPRRVYAAPSERKAWVIPPSHPRKTEFLVRLDDEESWFGRRIAAGDGEWIGPIPATSTYKRRGHQHLPPRKADN